MTENRGSSSLRHRASILAEIASIGACVRGSITQKHRKLADGTERVYHQLQCWSDGKNKTLHIPDELVEEFKVAVEGGHRLDRLAKELSDSDTQLVLSCGGSKKKPSR